jgi:acetyltransferase-like isoleucine patch superfamily enzyme
MDHATTPPATSTPSFASFGPGSTVAEPYRISCPERIHIGSNVHIAAGSWLSVVDEHLGRQYDPHLLIGDGANLGPDIVIACVGTIEIRPRVLTASRVFIGDTYHDYRDPHTAVLDQPMVDPRPVHIGEGAFLGIGSMVMPGVIVGEHAYVAAGAVVTTHVPSSTVVAGNPARVIRRWDQSLQRWVGAAVSNDGAKPGAEQQDELDRQLASLARRSAMAEAERLASERQLRELTLSRDALIAQLEDERRARAAAEYWLDDHRRSMSWRVTAPLRSVGRHMRFFPARKSSRSS